MALESVSLKSEPFPVTSPQSFFGTDQYTRLTVFGYNLELRNGEAPSAITLAAVDSQNRTYLLPVEAVNEVPNFSWITQVTVRLTDELQGVGSVALSIQLRGMASNALPLSIQ